MPPRSRSRAPAAAPSTVLKNVPAEAVLGIRVLEKLEGGLSDVVNIKELLISPSAAAVIRQLLPAVGYSFPNPLLPTSLTDDLWLRAFSEICVACSAIPSISKNFKQFKTLESARKTFVSWVQLLVKKQQASVVSVSDSVTRAEFDVLASSLTQMSSTLERLSKRFLDGDDEAEAGKVAKSRRVSYEDGNDPDSATDEEVETMLAEMTSGSKSAKRLRLTLCPCLA